MKGDALLVELLTEGALTVSTHGADGQVQARTTLYAHGDVISRCLRGASPADLGRHLADIEALAQQIRGAFAAIETRLSWLAAALGLSVTGVVAYEQAALHVTAALAVLVGLLVRLVLPRLLRWSGRRALRLALAPRP